MENGQRIAQCVCAWSYFRPVRSVRAESRDGVFFSFFFFLCCAFATTAVLCFRPDYGSKQKHADKVQWLVGKATGRTNLVNRTTGTGKVRNSIVCRKDMPSGTWLRENYTIQQLVDALFGEDGEASSKILVISFSLVPRCLWSGVKQQRLAWWTTCWLLNGIKCRMISNCFIGSGVVISNSKGRKCIFLLESTVLSILRSFDPRMWFVI